MIKVRLYPRSQHAFYKSIQRNDFLYHNLIFFAGSLSVGALNYIYYPLLGHLMPPHQFGETQVLFAILLDALVLLASLGMMVVNMTVNAPNDRARASVLATEQAVVTTFYILFPIWLVAIPLFTGFLKLDSGWPLVALYVVIFVSLLISVRQSFIQGMQDFVGVTVGSLIAASAKLILSAVLVIYGFGVTGAILGLALGQLVGVVYLSFRGKRRHQMRFSMPLPRLVQKAHLALGSHLVLPTLAVSLVVTALYSFDTIAVKHYFTSEKAGLYAGAAAIGRIIFFVTAPIATVMFTSLKIGEPKNRHRKILFLSLLTVTLIGGLVCLAFACLPEAIIQSLLGVQYQAAIAYLPPIAGTLFTASLLNILLCYGLSLRYASTGWVALAGLIGTILAIGAFHTSPITIIGDIFVVCMLMLIACFIVFFLPTHKQYQEGDTL